MSQEKVECTVPSQALDKEATENTSWDQLGARVVKCPRVNTITTLRETPLEYYQHQGPLVPSSAPLTFLQRYKPHQ